MLYCSDVLRFGSLDLNEESLDLYLAYHVLAGDLEHAVALDLMGGEVYLAAFVGRAVVDERPYYSEYS